LEEQVHEFKKELRSEIRIYKICVKSLMTYVIETRAETIIIKLRSTEVRTSGYIIGDALQSRIRNEDIRNICEIQDVNENVSESGN